MLELGQALVRTVRARGGLSLVCQSRWDNSPFSGGRRSVRRAGKHLEAGACLCEDSSKTAEHAHTCCVPGSKQ